MGREGRAQVRPCPALATPHDQGRRLRRVLHLQEHGALPVRARPDRAPLASPCARRSRRVSRPYGGRRSPQFRPRRPRRRHGPLSSLPGAPRVYVAGAVAVLLGAAPPPSRSRTRPPIPRTTHRTTSRTTWRDVAPPGYEPPATRDQQLGGRPAPPGNPGTHTPISPGADRAWG